MNYLELCCNLYFKSGYTIALTYPFCFSTEKRCVNLYTAYPSQMGATQMLSPSEISQLFFETYR